MYRLICMYLSYKWAMGKMKRLCDSIPELKASLQENHIFYKE